MARLAFPASGRAGVVGLTGSPGVGKSSLAAALVALLRRADERVAVLAVDPSSPLSGGAVLGDRVRMQAHAGDPGVFVRSMASRGAPGGLAPAAFDAVRLLDAAGWPWVLVETVGVGQAEADVRLVAETVVVVVAPGGGDGIQAVKAGIYEIADVFVVNKADRPGADEARGHLERMLDLVPARGWRPPVVATTAVSREGVDDLWAAVRRHRAWLTQGGRREARRAARLTAEVRHVALARAGHAGAERCRGPAFDEVVARVVAGRLDPSSAADALLG